MLQFTKDDTISTAHGTRTITTFSKYHSYTRTTTNLVGCTLFFLLACSLSLYSSTFADVIQYRNVVHMDTKGNTSTIDSVPDDVMIKEDDPRTALVMRTVAPIRPVILQRIYRLASDLQRLRYPYDFWIMVDETKHRGESQERLMKFFEKHGNKVAMPEIFAVSENNLLKHYPKLTSYIYNKPEPNFNNETGLCCGRPIMWQMFIPNFALFMNETGYDFGWSFEDDIDVYGELSLFELIRVWDQKLKNTVDLAAIKLHDDHWGKVRHTMAMERIVQQLNDANVTWSMFSDAIQRHSLGLSKDVVAEVSNNVMQFGERLIYPIAWKHNRTTVDLDEMSNDVSLFGINNMTIEVKLSSNLGVEELLKTNSTPATLIFHEELPTRRR